VSPRLRGVLIDIDGTLLDSNDAHARSWADVFAEKGMGISFEQVRPLVGMGSDKLLPELTGLDHESAEGERLVQRKKEVFEKGYLPHLRPTKGARELMERMVGEGLTLVIATSAGGDELRALLKQAGVEDLVDDATSSGDVDSSKPDPDVIGAALRKGGLRPNDAIMLGDTPYDVEAAARAGVPTVALRCGGWWDDDALSGAVAIYNDPTDLLANYDESPLVGGTGSWEVPPEDFADPSAAQRPGSPTIDFRP
jgi:HAD superfamily hydrolase (TIGR01509 family)